MKFVGLVALILGLASCGKDFCVGPFGDCWKDLQADPSGADSGTGTLTRGRSGQLEILVPQQYQGFKIVPKGTRLELTATGGAGNYRWQKLDGDGTLDMDGKVSNTASYDISATAAPQGSHRIQVTDSSGRVYAIGFRSE